MALFILTVGLMIILMLGIPAAFTMILSSAFLLGIERGFANIPYQMIAQRVFNGMDSFPLLSVPLFILVGQLMNDAGVTDRIFNLAKVFVGHLRGGLAHVNIIASLIFAGMSGSAVADAAGLGAIEIKAMTDGGYDLDFSVGVTASSSLIGPIIPPSIPVVLYAVLAGVSVTRLLIAGFIPGLIMTLCLMAYVSYRARKTEYPIMPRATLKEFWHHFKEAFFPILTPIILVGGIVSGIFTATEASGVAALYASILFLFYKKFSIKALLNVFRKTLVTSANVMFILAAAQIYSTLVIRSRIPVKITEIVFMATSTYWGVLLLVVFLLLLAGCFMSTAVAINILTPVLVPLVVIVGVDPLYFGIIMILTLMIGQLTPPFGMVLYAIMSICEIPYHRLIKTVILFTIPIFVSLVLLLIFPRLVTFLPGLY